MSINKVEVRTALGSLLTLTLGDISNGYIVEDIEGLGPVKATLSSSSFANMPGSRFQSSRRGNRNILLKLKLQPVNYAAQTVLGLRSHLYSFFETETEVRLRFFMNDGRTLDISGRVESCEPPMFTNEPRVNVSIVCFDPDFVELDPIVETGETVDDAEEFTIDYPGTVPIGIIFVLEVDRILTEFTIYHRPADNVVRTFDFAGDLEENDILTINTIKGQKQVIRTRVGVNTSLLYGKTPQSTWITLMKGENNLRVFAEGDPIPFSITYTPRYGGL